MRRASCECLFVYTLYLSYQQACRSLSLSLALCDYGNDAATSDTDVGAFNLAFPFADHLLLYAALPISALYDHLIPVWLLLLTTMMMMM
jgi:hypothetical protein